MPYVKGVRGALPEDLSGQTFGRLSVQRRDTEKVTRTHWVCLCRCGATKSVASHQLKSGKTKSCGCYNRERRRIAPVKHGLARSPTYVSWCAMHARCSNPKLRSYKNYGGRGISVCARWSDFSCFLSDMGERPPGRSIDRVDVNGNYEPGNCRWATASEQRRNQRAAAEIGRTMP